MATEGLRARLRSLQPERALPQKAPRGLKVVQTAYPLPRDLLRAADPRAIERLGADFLWPEPERVLFLDTETTGLSRGAGTIAFLIGIGRVRGDEFLVTQYLLGDYPDEPEALLALSAVCENFDALVTFNGKNFDWPLLESRYTMNRLRDMLPRLEHLDLLFPSRRLWRRRLGTVKLSELEKRVLASGRRDDLPGSEAPARFFEYLKTGDDSGLEPVLLHNRLDVLSLAKLLSALLRAYGAPSVQAEAADLLSMGKALERRGERDEALICYRMATLPRAMTTVASLRNARHAGEAMMAQGLLLKKSGDLKGAAACWERLAQKGLLGALPLVELAKYHEHSLRDYKGARIFAKRALAVEDRLDLRAALERRAARLDRKIKKSEAEL